MAQEDDLEGTKGQRKIFSMIFLIFWVSLGLISEILLSKFQITKSSLATLMITLEESLAALVRRVTRGREMSG